MKSKSFMAAVLANAILGPHISGGPMTQARGDQPKTSHDWARLEAAQKRRDKRAFKRAENIRKSTENKYKK